MPIDLCDERMVRDRETLPQIPRVKVQLLGTSAFLLHSVSLFPNLLWVLILGDSSFELFFLHRDLASPSPAPLCKLLSIDRVPLGLIRPKLLLSTSLLHFLELFHQFYAIFSWTIFVSWYLQFFGAFWVSLPTSRWRWFRRSLHYWWARYNTFGRCILRLVSSHLTWL